MASFVTAYIVVWLGVVWYVARLGAQQRRLSRAVELLQAQCEAAQREGGPDA